MTLLVIVGALATGHPWFATILTLAVMADIGIVKRNRKPEGVEVKLTPDQESQIRSWVREAERKRGLD